MQPVAVLVAIEKKMSTNIQEIAQNLNISKSTVSRALRNHFTWLDSIVNDALARRIEPWIQISYGNELYPDAGGISLGEGLPTSDVAYEAWLNYTEALVDHFKDRVDIWEIWNEADHRYNAGGPELYARLYYETAKKVRAIQPNATLVGLSMAGIGRTKYVDFFFNYLQERDALHLVDAVTFHGYPRNPDDGFEAVIGSQELAYSYRPGIEFWQGETGCPSTLGSSGALSGHPWSELTQAKWNLRRALAHVGRGYPFSLFTISEYNYNRKKFKGLNTKGILKINDDLSIAYAKPAYYAYQNLTSLLDHQMERLPALSFQSQCDSSLSVYAYRHKVSKAPMIFTWIDSSIPADSNQLTNAGFTFNGINFEDPVLVDLISGKVFELPDKMIEIRGSQVYFSAIPVYDSPLVLVDRKLIRITGE